MTDYTNSLPDECLALIFNFLTTSKDHKNSSLVSHRWLRIEAQTHTHLALNARSELQLFIPSIFTRFNSLTQLVLHKNPTSVVSINDNDMILITSMCPNLRHLILHACEQLTDSGMADFSKNCKKLKEFSCVDCSFSDLGIFELLNNSSQLEVLSVKRSFYSPGVGAPPKFRAGAAVKTLKVFELRNVYSEWLFEPLIIGSKNLKRLKLISCVEFGDLSLEMIPDDNCLVEVHLEDLNVSDVGFSSLSKCRDLNSLQIVNNLRCTNVGLISVVERCKGLRRLYIDDWCKSEIGNEGLIAVGNHSVNLQQLVLKGVSVSCVSLEVIATNCQKLVRLELCRSETITDVEMMCIAEKCVALKVLCIKKCPVSDKGIKAFALGCPNLAEIMVTKCKKVTREVKDTLRASRESLVIKIEFTQ